MRTKQFDTIWKTFYAIKWSWGVDNQRRASKQRWYFRFMILNTIFCITNNVTSLAKFSGQDTVRATLVGFVSSAMGLLVLFKIIFVKTIKSYKDCLKWCEKWHAVPLEYVGIKERIEKCGSRARKLFKVVVVFGSSWSFLVLFIGTLILSFLKGTIAPFAPTLVIWTMEEGPTNQLINSLNQLFVGFDLVLVQFLFFAIVFITVEYILTTVDCIQIILRHIEAPISPAHFKRIIETVVNWHTDLIEQQGTLASITSMSILAYEIFSYALAFVIWTVFLFDNRQYFIAIVCLGMVVPFIILCWMNERILNAYANLKTELFNLDWNGLQKYQKQMILLVMVMVDRPILLRAGPFHLISFELLNYMLNRTYSFGLVLKNVIGTT